MDLLLKNIIPLMGGVVSLHMFYSFFHFWMVPRHHSFVYHLRNIKYISIDNQGTGKTLIEIPEIEFQSEENTESCVNNFALNVLEKIGLPVLKHLVGFSTMFLILALVLKYTPLPEFINSYAPNDSPYPIESYSHCFFWISFLTYLIYFFLFTRMDIAGMLCKNHADYKDKNVIGFIFKLH